MPQEYVCKVSGKVFIVNDNEAAYCKSINVPVPILSPEERFRTLMGFRNEWKLYRRTCDLSGKTIISSYHPESPFTVYDNSIWWGDSWDAATYGRDFSFDKSFFDQFAALQRDVPREGTTIFNSVNCDYNSHTRESKNCYLNSLVARCEDVYYSYWMVESKDVFDSVCTTYSTLCYECKDVNNCYNCFVLEESSQCSDCYFSYQLRGCRNCIFSTDLVNAEYAIYNKPCTKEEFETFKKKLLDGSYTTWTKAYNDYLELRKQAKNRAIHSTNCENVTGDHIYNSRNCTNCFDTFDSEDCVNTISASGSKDIYSAYSAGWTSCEQVYMSLVSRGCTTIAFCNYSWFSSNLLYCENCVSCHDCFGCIGLKHKQYYILNKQYSQEEYEKLVPKIIEQMKKASLSHATHTPTLTDEEHMYSEWGNFFPPSLSPFAYNETAAQDFFPLTEAEATQRGWRWLPRDTKEYASATIPVLPDSIHEVQNSITNAVLACEYCTKNYKIIPQELAFYKKCNLPLPRWCSTCRHQSRMTLRNSPVLHERTCISCNKKIDSTFAPHNGMNVWCDECYYKAVY